jgi:acyl carrier protein
MDQLLSRDSRRQDSISRETRERIRAVFANSLRLNSRDEELTYEQILDEATSLDSIAVVEFLAAVEKEFGVELEPAVIEFEFLRDVAALASYIEDRLRRPSKLETGGQDPIGLNSQ